jgi:hypothetical protein
MSKCIQKTVTFVKQLSVRVNDFLERDNGTRFLTMEYEEVLYPALFLTKKMYIGTPHIREVNFNAKPFIKGLTANKRGASKLHKIKTAELIAKILDINNLYSVRDNVFRMIREMYTHTWDFETEFDLFVLTREYRPDKMNIGMNNFVERMKKNGYEIRPAERFEIVYVEYDRYTIKGTKSNLNKSEYTELAEVVKQKRMKIDIDTYFNSGIDAQFASFISHYPDFQREKIVWETFNTLPEDEQKLMLKNIAKKQRETAKKYIENYRKTLVVGFSDGAGRKEKYNERQRMIKDLYKTDTFAAIVYDNFVNNNFGFQSQIMKTFNEMISDTYTDYRGMAQGVWRQYRNKNKRIYLRVYKLLSEGMLKVNLTNKIERTLNLIEQMLPSGTKFEEMSFENIVQISKVYRELFVLMCTKKKYEITIDEFDALRQKHDY